MSTSLAPKDLRVELTRFTPRMAEVVAARGGAEYAHRQVGLAMLAVQKNADLLKCDPVSIAQAMIRICSVKLEIGTTAYLVPFGRECTAIIAAAGLIELMLRSGHVRDVFAAAVHAGDHFRMTLGTAPTLEHEPANGERGAVVGYYAVAKLRHGYPTFEYMTAAEVEKIRAAARSGNSPAWKGHPIEMGKKTVIRRLAKRMPQTDALRSAIEHDELTGTMEATPGTPAAILADPLRGNDGNRMLAKLPQGNEYGTASGDIVDAETGEVLREAADAA